VAGRRIPGPVGETLERNYGHHHPTYMQEAARAIGYGRGKRVPLAERSSAR
jgi:hypothetical protein